MRQSELIPERGLTISAPGEAAGREHGAPDRGKHVARGGGAKSCDRGRERKQEPKDKGLSLLSRRT